MTAVQRTSAQMLALWLLFGRSLAMSHLSAEILDAGRLSWLFGREVIAAEDPFDPASYDAMLRINVRVAEASFPDIFDGTYVEEGQA